MKHFSQGIQAKANLHKAPKLKLIHLDKQKFKHEIILIPSRNTIQTKCTERHMIFLRELNLGQIFIGYVKRYTLDKNNITQWTHDRN